jgi:hypothetical protein
VETDNNQNQKPDFSDSTRQLLDQLAKEKEHRDWLRAKRKERMEYVRGWITWITAAWVLKGLLWESFTGFMRDHFR